MMEQPVKDGAGGWDIAQEFAPFFDWAVGSHHGRAVLVTAHDDLQEDFAALGWQDLQAHVVDDQKVGLEIAGKEAGFTRLGLFLQKVAHQVEHRTVEDEEPGFDGLCADGLGQVAFAHSGRPCQQHVAVLPDEVTGCQFVNAGSGHRWVKAEVEVFEVALLAKAGGLIVALDQTLVADVDFVLEHQFEELTVGEAVGFGFLKAQLNAVEQSREAQLLGMAFDGLVHRLMIWIEG